MQVVFKPPSPSKGIDTPQTPDIKDADAAVIYDVVIPAFGGSGSSKKRFAKQKTKTQQQHQQEDNMMDCLEFPTKQSREIMRQVSGLGMEDPVFGLLSAHGRMTKRAAKSSIPHLYDDMGLADFPADMRDMLSICSDPTASVVGELPSMSDIFADSSEKKQKQKQKASEWPTDRNSETTKSGRILSSSRPIVGTCKAVQNFSQSRRTTKLIHPFVPPISIHSITKEPVNNKSKKLHLNGAASHHHHNHQQQQQQQQDGAKPVNQQSQNAGSKHDFDAFAIINHNHKKSPRHQKDILNDDWHHRSCQFEAWESTAREAVQDVANHKNSTSYKDDVEMELSDVFAMGNSSARNKTTSKLHASDSHLVFHPQRQRQEKLLQQIARRSIGDAARRDTRDVEGLELNMAIDTFDRTISGLTTVVPPVKEEEEDDDQSFNVFSPDLEARTVQVDGELVSVPVLGIQPNKQQGNQHNNDCGDGKDDSGKLELYDLMKSQQSLALYELQKVKEEEEMDPATHTSSRERQKPKKEQEHRKKGSRRSTRIVKLPPDLTDESSPAVNQQQTQPASQHTSRRQKMLNSKVTKPELDDSRLFRHSIEKAGRSTKARRSHSLECKESEHLRHRIRKQSHRRSTKDKKVTPRKSKTHDGVTARMLALGNASMQAVERAEELQSKQHRESKHSIPTAADLHASMGQLALSSISGGGGGPTPSLRLAGNRSCVDFNF